MESGVKSRSIENRIIIGIACITASIILVGWIAINENARMEEFTERSQGRAVEQGAILFESNCATCHGFNGLGSTRAPALNNPVLFGYDFLKPVKDEQLLVESQLQQATDPAEITRLQTRLEELDAEEQVLVESILYDWSTELADMDADLAALDAQIETLEGIEPGRASGIAAYIGRREADELAPLLQEQSDLQAKLDSGTALTAEESERLAQLETEIAAVDEALAPYRDFSDQRAGLVEKRGRFQTLVDSHEKVKTARAELSLAETALAALGEAPAEGGDPNARAREVLEGEATAASDLLDTAEAERDAAYQALLDAGDVLPYDPTESTQVNRLTQVGWASTLYAFLEGTLIGGRPTSAAYWPQPMAAWSQETGGPLRPDQVSNLVEFILAWDREFTVQDLRAVQHFAKVPSEGGGAPAGTTIGDNPDEIAANLATLRESGEFEASPATGQSLFEGGYGCSGCHGQAAGAGPALTGLWTRASENQENRLTDTGTDGNPEAYLIHSIVNPNEYVVGGFAEGVMPQNFGDRLTIEELAHILAYLEEQN